MFFFFCANYSSEIRSALSLKLSEEHAHLVESVWGQQLYKHGQAYNPKQKAYSSLSVMTLSGL